MFSILLDSIFKKIFILKHNNHHRVFNYREKISSKVFIFWHIWLINSVHTYQERGVQERPYRISKHIKINILKIHITLFATGLFWYSSAYIFNILTFVKCSFASSTFTAAVLMFSSIRSSRLPCSITIFCNYLYKLLREWIDFTIFKIY